MFQKIKNKIKNLFSPLICLKSPDKERGIAFIPALLIISAVIAIGGKVAANVGGWLGTTGAKFAGAIAWVFMYLCYILAKFAAGVFTGVVNSSFIAQTITKDPTFIMGFDIVRNFANMFIVLGFVVVGIATILRIMEYQFQKTLLPLIIVAILVNFAPLLCGLVIDASNIATDYFLKGGGTGTIGERLLGDISEGMDLSLKDISTNDVGNWALSCFMSAIMYIIMAAVFLILGLLFIVRKVLLLALVILSPLAFVSYPFKATKTKIFDVWLQKFLEWCLAGVTASFFMYLAGQILMSEGKIAGPSDINKFLVPMVFMFMAYKLAMGTKAMGAAAVIGLAAGGAGLALGATKKIGGAVMEKAGRTNNGRAIREKLSSAGSRIAEATGFAPQGHAAQQKATREGTARKQVDALRTSSSQGDKNRFKELVKNGRGAMGAAAVASANEHGELGKILNPDNNAAGLNTMSQRVAYAKQFGHEGSEFEKKNYNLAQFNDGKTDQALTAMGHKAAIDGTFKNPAEAAKATATQRVAAAEKLGLPIADAREKVMMTQLADAMPQMSAGELSRVDSTHLGPDNYDFAKENLTPHIIEKMGIGSNRALIAGVQTHVPRLEKDLKVAIDNNDKAEANKLQKLINSIKKTPGYIDSSAGYVGGAGI